MPLRLIFSLAIAFSTATVAIAQSTDEEPDFDECGTLSRIENCVLFEGGGGSFVLGDYGSYQAGDTVRVVGFLDEGCITICGESADGCIRGAVVYDPEVFPCGTDINVDFDPCGGLGAGLTLLSLTGLIATRPRKPNPRISGTSIHPPRRT